MSQTVEWAQLMELIKLKREKPEEYKQLTEDIVVIMKDMKNITERVLK